MSDNAQARPLKKAHSNHSLFYAKNKKSISFAQKDSGRKAWLQNHPKKTLTFLP